MPFTEYFDERLDIKSTDKYEISIQVSLDGFYYALFERSYRRVVLFRAHEPEGSRLFSLRDIDSFFREDQFLSKDYSRLSLMTPVNHFTLIPAPLYDPALKEEYYRLNCPGDESLCVMANSLPSSRVILVYAASRDICDLVSRHFPGDEPEHQLRHLIENLVNKRESPDTPLLHINAEHGFIDIVVITSGGELKLCNSYPCSNRSDFIYYALSAARSEGFPSDGMVRISGITASYGDIARELAPYFSDTASSTLCDNISLMEGCPDHIRERHTTLFSSFTCE